MPSLVEPFVVAERAGHPRGDQIVRPCLRGGERAFREHETRQSLRGSSAPTEWQCCRQMSRGAAAASSPADQEVGP